MSSRLKGELTCLLDLEGVNTTLLFSFLDGLAKYSITFLLKVSTSFYILFELLTLRMLEKFDLGSTTDILPKLGRFSVFVLNELIFEKILLWCTKLLLI